MILTKGVGEFFGLDIGTTAVRAVQLTRGGVGKWTLAHYGYVPIDQKTSEGDSDEAKVRLREAITTVIGQSGIKTKNVVTGLPSTKTFVTVVDMPLMPANELAGMIKYQADDFIPMASDNTKVDWKVLGTSLHDPSKQEVLLASTTNSFSEERLDLLEELGLNVIAAEPDSLAMIRSVLPKSVKGAQLIVDLGEMSTDVAVVFDDMPRLVRTIPTGLSTLIRVAVQNLSIEQEQARQFIVKFGLSSDKLEGQVVRALEPTLEGFVSELRKSIGFFGQHYPSAPVEGILLSGFASVIPNLGEYIGQKLAISATYADPWHAVSGASNDQQLGDVRAEFAVAVGLAQRGGQ